VAKANPSSGVEIKISSRERLDINLSTTFAELAITSANMFGKEGEQDLQNVRGGYAPYSIRNCTGTPILVWSDIDGSTTSKERTGVTVLNDQTIDWRFDDWKTMREVSCLTSHLPLLLIYLQHVSSSGQHSMGLHFTGKPWEQLRSIPVDREGQYVFPLRPRTDQYTHRLLCEVKVVDNVKVVTFRSACKIQNLTLYPLELTLIDDLGQPVYSLEKIAPGQDYSLPIEAVSQNRIRIQPDRTSIPAFCIHFNDLIHRGFWLQMEYGYQMGRSGSAKRLYCQMPSYRSKGSSFPVPSMGAS
jgi:vacuolar protein sorting-associated protein 13A/C